MISPVKPDFEREYRVDLEFVFKALAGLNGNTDLFSMDVRGRPVTARRRWRIEVREKGGLFTPLKTGVQASSRGADFRVHLDYSYLDEKYNYVPTRGDSFLLSFTAKNKDNNPDDTVVVKASHLEGPRRTGVEDVVEAVVK